VLMAAVPHNPFEHYCSLILLGKRVPHPPSWDALRGCWSARALPPARPARRTTWPKVRGAGCPAPRSQERCAPGRSQGLGGRAARPRCLHRGDPRSEQGAVGSAQAGEGAFEGGDTELGGDARGRSSTPLFGRV